MNKLNGAKAHSQAPDLSCVAALTGCAIEVQNSLLAGLDPTSLSGKFLILTGYMHGFRTGKIPIFAFMSGT